MDLGKAFSFVFDDDQWLVVLLIGGLLLLIPIAGVLLLLGFTMETARNVMRRSDRPLPRWENFGEKLSLGLHSFVIQLVYALPAILLGLLFACAAVAVALGARDAEELAMSAIPLMLICFVPLITVVSLVVQPITWAAHGRYLQTGSLRAALQVGEVLAMTRSSLGTWVVVWLLYMLCGIVGSAGSIVLFIGLIFTIPYGQAVFGHILGQVSAPQGAPYMPPPPPYQ